MKIQHTLIANREIIRICYFEKMSSLVKICAICLLMAIIRAEDEVVKIDWDTGKPKETESAKREPKDETEQVYWEILDAESELENTVSPGDEDNVVTEAFDLLFEEEQIIYDNLDPQSGNFGEDKET